MNVFQDIVLMYFGQCNFLNFSQCTLLMFSRLSKGKMERGFQRRTDSNLQGGRSSNSSNDTNSRFCNLLFQNYLIALKEEFKSEYKILYTQAN